MPPLDPDTYPPPIAALLRELPLAPLGPGRPDPARRASLAAVTPTALGLPDSPMLRACQAGLWLAFDFLDEAHTISQDLETAEGSFWHAILHRREPDPSNAKYWWRRVGDHPVFAALAATGATLGWSAWDPFAFVDECERHRGKGGERETLLREAQMAEWRTLFAWCWSRR